MSGITNNLSAHLFWDTKVSELDMQKNKRLIVDRVLHRGTQQEWDFIIDYYGQKELIEILCELPVIAPKEANFVKVLFNINPNQMKCYTNKRLNHNY
ncbi:MAG: hypothetical protein IT246_00580 [Bacteroidia bacterium]|nr:hypothetical protein [Bacteroidia bacterium]